MAGELSGNALGIDVGAIYRTVEAVKASRDARELERAKLDNALATQKASQQVAATAGEDPKAMAQLIAINPAMAKQITETYSALDEAGRKKKRDQLEQVGGIAAGILQASNPAQAYKEARASLPPEIAATLPPEYSEDWVKVQLARTVEADKIYDSIDGDRTAARDQQNKLALQNDAQAATASEGDKNRANALAVKADERQFQRSMKVEDFKNDLVKIEAKAKADAGKSGGQLESKDSSEIYKQAVQLMGGIFDQQGNVTINDPDARPKAQEIAVKASALYASGEAKTHAEAVKRAAQELNIQFPGDKGNPLAAPANDPFANGMDPLGILGK